MRLISAIVVAVAFLNLGIVATADDKPKPRVPTAAEKRELQKERKAKLKERADRAKANAKQHEELAAKIRAALEPWDKKGLSGCVLVAKDGKVIFKQAYGFADREAKRKNAVDTYFDAARITRLVTTLCVLRLEMEGKLSLEDKLSKFFKFAPATTGAVTLTQLLSNTSGITKGDALESVDTRVRDDTIRKLLTEAMIHEPGAGPVDNPRNFNIAAAVIEVASGQKYEDYARKAVLEPAGMKDSEFCPAGKLDKKRGAVCYIDESREHEILTHNSDWTAKGNRALAATAEDLWKLSEAIDWSDILDNTAREKLCKEVPKWQCLPFVKNPAGTLGAAYSLNGVSWGARADFIRYPEADIVLILLANNERKEPIEPGVVYELEKILAEAGE